MKSSGCYYENSKFKCEFLTVFFGFGAFSLPCECMWIFSFSVLLTLFLFCLKITKKNFREISKDLLSDDHTCQVIRWGLHFKLRGVGWFSHFERIAFFWHSYFEIGRTAAQTMNLRLRNNNKKNKYCWSIHNENEPKNFLLSWQAPKSDEVFDTQFVLFFFLNLFAALPLFFE